jgi:hypothetical protein
MIVFYMFGYAVIVIIGPAIIQNDRNIE